MPVAIDDKGSDVTVRAYLSILAPLAIGLLCHWRYWRLSRPGIGPIRLYHVSRSYLGAAWFCYGMATSSAALFVIWAVT